MAGCSARLPARPPRRYGDVICTTVPEIVVVMAYDFFSVFWWA